MRLVLLEAVMVIKKQGKSEKLPQPREVYTDKMTNCNVGSWKRKRILGENWVNVNKA